MRLWCWYCHRSVSSELPESTIFRAIAICPECTQEERDQQAAQHSVHPTAFHVRLLIALSVGCNIGGLLWLLFGGG